MGVRIKSTSNRLWQFSLTAKAALRRSTKFHTKKRQRQAFFILKLHIKECKDAAFFRKI
jgi:hypothetical protein